MNSLRLLLESGKKVFGTLINLTDPCIGEVFGNIGYDCVWIDTEHTYMSHKEVLCHLNAAKASGISAVVRVPQNDLTATKQILEMGPDGIIFPMVKSSKELNELIAATLYPPLGIRGFGPMRAIGYGARDAKEYVTKSSLDLCRFIQIEHIDLINELEEIVKNPYVDGFIFGPNDLSLSLNDTLNVFGETTFSKIRYATELLKKHNKIIGVAGGISEEEIEKWSTLDLDMYYMGSDWGFIYDRGKENLQRLKNFTKG